MAVGGLEVLLEAEAIWHAELGGRREERNKEVRVRLGRDHICRTFYIACLEHLHTSTSTIIIVSECS